MLALLLGGFLTADASAQFLPVFGLPVIGQSGLSFHIGGRRLRMDGFLPLGSAYPAVVPVTPTPFGFRQIGPAVLPYGYGYSFPVYGAIDRRITVQIINPPGLPRSAGLRRIPDLSGIDLDVEPASKIWGEKPIVAKVAPPDAKKAEAVANQAKAPALAAPPSNGQQLNDLGVAAFRTGDYGVALLRFRQAVDADTPRALFLRGQACIAVGKYRDGVEAIQQGLKLQPNWPTSGFDPKTELYGKQNQDWKEHRRQLERTQAKNPNNADYFFLLGYLAWFDGERDTAVDYFQQARALATEPRWVDMFLKAAKGK
jgi:tetratricopeptide (TPR) repeat protein